MTVSVSISVPIPISVPTAMLRTAVSVLGTTTIISTAAIVPIPVVTSPITPAVVIPVSVPADHNRRRIHGRGLIDNGRRRRRVIRLRRYIDGCRNPDIDAQVHAARMGRTGHGD